MISKISVHVESSFENIAVEKNLDFKEYTKSVVKTYSSVSLTNIEQLYFENKIGDYLTMGTKAQRENRTGDALRYYYWAYALWLSHPYRDEIETSADGKQILTGILLDNRINSLLSAVNFQVTEKLKYKKEDKTKLLLSCTCNGHKVANLDFTYFSGQTKSTLQEVENGRSEIYLFGAEQDALNKLTIRIEYKYLKKSYQDKELSSVLNTVVIPFFKKSRKTIPVGAQAENVNPKKIIKPGFSALNKLNEPKNKYATITKQLLIDVIEKDYDAAYNYFTAGGK